MIPTYTLLIRFGDALADMRARGQLKPWQECAMTERLTEFVTGLLGDLGLTGYRFQAQVAGPAERASRFAFSFELAGVSCPGALELAPSTVLDPERLTEIIIARLFEQRVTLFAGPISSWEWERRLSYPAARGLQHLEFHNVVADAIRRGLAVPATIDRLFALLDGGLEWEDAPDQFEPVLDMPSEPQVGVRVWKTCPLTSGTLIDDVRRALFMASGLMFPPLSLTVDERLGEGECRIGLNRLWTPTTSIDPEDPVGSLTSRLRTYAPVFVTIGAVDAALGRLATAFPMIIFDAIETFGTAFATQVLRALVQDGVCIRNLRTILGALLEVNGRLPHRYDSFEVVLPYEATLLSEPSVGDQTAQVDRYASLARIQIRDQICQACADPGRVLHLVRLSAGLEERLARIEDEPLSEDETYNVLSAARRACGPRPHGTVVLASSRNRKRLQGLLHPELPGLAVLCEAEISSFVTCKEMGRLDV